jgi:hypothetical protein
MPRLLAALLAGAALSACTAGAGGRLSYEGAVYRQLTGRQLRLAIVGHALTLPPPRGDAFVVTSHVCYLFHPGGAYGQCGDRVPLVSGTYALANDRVCARLGAAADPTCWLLYGGPDGRYLLRRVSPADDALPARVILAPLPN